MRASRQSDARVLACLVLASVLVNLLLLAWIGIRTGADTVRYIRGAEDLLSGRPFGVPIMLQYLGYVGLVALSSATGTGLTGVIAVHLGAAALAALALFDLGRQLSGRIAGTVAAAAFILNVDIARWHAYVLSDSMYISCVVLATWCVDRAVERGWGAYAAAALVVLVTASIRPNGWIFGPLVAVYWISRSRLGKGTRIAVACALVAGLGVIVSLVLYQRYSTVILNPPRGWDNMRAFADVWLGLFGYGPEENRLAQAANRVLMELAHVRPRFSLRHNAAIVAILAVTYPLAVVGFIRERRHPLSRWMAGVIAGHLVVVALTFGDRDGRYLLYVFPLILVFAGCGASALANRGVEIFSRRRSPSPLPR